MRKNDNSKITARHDKQKYEWFVFAHYKDLLGQIVYKFLDHIPLKIWLNLFIIF